MEKLNITLENYYSDLERNNCLISYRQDMQTELIDFVSNQLVTAGISADSIFTV